MGTTPLTSSMTTDELRNHFILHGVKCISKRNEVLIQTCVFCGNTKWNLEANPTSGVYHCWTCNAGGRVDKLLREVTGVSLIIPVTLDQKEQRKLANPEAAFDVLLGRPAADDLHCAEYCRSRRLSMIDMAIYQLRTGVKGSKFENRVVFPLLDYWSRYIVGCVGRSTTGAWPKWYGSWIDKKCVTGYRAQSDVHVVVEGAMDGIRVHKAGFNAAVLIGTANRGVEEWAARVPVQHYVVVMLDADAHLEGERLFWRIFPIHEKVKLVKLSAPMDPESLEETVLQTLIGRLDVG